MMNCPKCNNKCIPHPDISYRGEFFICEPCNFGAYFDEWDENGNFIQKTGDPF